MSQRRTISEAPESNAGDDFHVLWAMKRSFDLLNFEEDGLKTITIEGISPKIANQLDPTGYNFLGVDIAEYYGGDNFTDSSKVVIAQLKYSTRKISDDYTFSELYKGKKSGSYDGSILHRLAQTYKTYLDEYGRDLVLKKLSLKLISNRNVSPNQKTIIKNIQQFLNNKSGKTRFRTICKEFAQHETPLTKIKTATGLNPIEFTDFLRLLDFDDCGTSSSHIQELESIKAMEKVGIRGHHQFNSLYRTIVKMMLPDAIEQETNKMTFIDLLLGMNMQVPKIESLFPVNQKFEEIENLVEREQVETLIDDIIKNDSGNPICLHGGAGIGKSTITHLIQQNFPSESEVFRFDCYGAGDYLNPSDRRHLHKEAIIQLSNEMAKRIGSPFLLPVENDNYGLVREFKSRINDALKILKEKSPDALIVLIIDAADNSITAAEQNQEESFVTDLVNETFPENFRLVVTARSYRIESLKLPSKYIDISLRPFSEAETKAHISHYFPESSQEEIKSFHTLTQGIPRVQSYILGMRNEGIEQIINYLRPNGKTVDDLIEDRINEAVRKMGDDRQTIEDFFATLITLPRPVPIKYIEDVSGLNNALIHDLTTDIWHGLVFNPTHHTLSFRDEDFENYIRQKYEANETILNRVAEVFLQKASEDEYASLNLGTALYTANHLEQLKNIVLDEQYRELPIDPMRNKQVYIDRAKLAMKASTHTDDVLAFFKLSFIAADAAKTDKALKNLLINNTDLAALLGETDSLERLNPQLEEESWAGSFYCQLAGIASRKKQFEVAKKYLKNAHAWIEWKQRQPDTEKVRQYEISALDIAYGAEAHLRISGPEDALNWLESGRPKTVVYQAADYLINNLSKHASEEEILRWVSPLNFSIYEKLMLIERCNFLCESLFDIQKIADEVLRLLSRINLKVHLFRPIITFCELLVKSGKENKDKALAILEKIKIQPPVDTFTSYRMGESSLRVGLFLKRETLKAVISNTSQNIEDIYPAELKNIDEKADKHTKKRMNEKKKSFERFYSHALPIYQLRADTINGNLNNVSAKFKDICEKAEKDWDFRHYERSFIKDKLAFFASSLIDVVPFLGKQEEAINNIIQSFRYDKHDTFSISLRIAIVAKMVKYKELQDKIFPLLSEVDTLIQDSLLTASEQSDFYLHISKICTVIDLKISRIYFDKAEEVASKVDSEAHDQIRCLSELIYQIGIPKENPKLAFEFSRYIEFCEIRLRGYDNFPLEEGFESIALLDCASAFAILCRWDHRYVTTFTEQILIVLEVAVNRDFIGATTASSMLPICSWERYTKYLEFIKKLIAKYDDLGDSELKNIFIKNTFRDIQIISKPSDRNQGICEEIYQKIQDGKFLDKGLVQRIGEYNQFLQDLSEVKTVYTERDDYHSPDEFTTDLSTVDITSSKSISETLKKFGEDGRAYYMRSRFLESLIAKCPPQNRIAHLDALIDIEPTLIDFHEMQKALSNRLKAWDSNPLVKQWKSRNFEKVVRMCFHQLIEYHSLYSRIYGLVDIFSVDMSEAAKVITEILPDNIEFLSAELLYETIAFLKVRLNKAQNEELLDWVLQRWNSKIDDDFGDGVWNRTLDISSLSTNEVIAQTLRYLLGHPDKRVRWRAVHTLRRLVISRETDILKHLIRDQNKTSCFPFQHKEYTYFWLSAKLYLWICIAKLSIETPAEIAEFRDDILKEVHEQNPPHVLILYFVKQTCLNLYKYDNSIFSDAELGAVNELLTSKFKPVEKNRPLTRRQTKDDGSDLRFNFSTMDTIDYWYSHLGKVFNLAEYDVARMADKYITEKWGYVGNVREDNHVEADWDLTSNRKGELPTVENLKRYYEYHAMLCAAGEFLQLYPLVDLSASNYGSWEYWLNGWVTTWKGKWLADLTDPSPMDRKFWISEFSKFDKTWQKVDDKYYDGVLKLPQESITKRLYVRGNYTRHFGENYERVTIASALVHPETSGALLKALQFAKSDYDFWLPTEGSDYEIIDGKFQLVGWLDVIGCEHGISLEKNDPFTRQIGNSYIAFGDSMNSVFDLDYSDDFKITRYNGKSVSTYQNWDNTTDDNRRYGEFQNTGELFEADTSFLLEFLQKRNMDMIIKCTVKRELERELREPTPKYENNAKIYLIKSNGEIKTVTGSHYQIG